MKKIYLLGCLLLAIATTRAQNNALTFDGADDYVDCGNSASLAANTLRTLECWVKFNTTSGDREILSKSTSGQGIELLQFGGNLAAYCMFNSSNTSYITYPMSNFSTGVWYHIALSWNGTKESIRLYVNGVSVGNLAHIGNINTTGISNPAGNFLIGQWSGTPGRFFSGSIDEVRVWTTTRTAGEIKKGMFNAVATSMPGLVAYYKFNEGSGTLAANSTGATSLNGTLISGPSWLASPVQSGSNALHFASNREQVVVPANPLLNLTSGTIECWIKPSTMDYNGCILGVRGTGGTRFSFHVNTSTGRIGLWNNSAYNTVSYPFVTGNWYHVAFVCTGTTTQFYINGNFVQQINSAFSTVTGQPFVIGVAKDPGMDEEGMHFGEFFEEEMPVGEVNNEPFLGEIDEVRVWSTQRTATEINSNKDISLSGAETGLVAQYTFNQGVAGANNSGLVTVIDQSNNSLHGTLTNFTLSGSTSNYAAHAMVVLPVRWASFTAVKKGEGVVLQWQTSVEINSRLFAVERSVDGVSFTQIGTVPAGGSPGTYYYNDIQPQQGTNHYRIKQLDQNGQIAYSSINAVTFTPPGSFTNINHQNGSCTLVLKGGSDEMYMISDMSGRVMESGRLTGGRKTVSLAHAGTYIASVIQNGERLNTRISIQ